VDTRVSQHQAGGLSHARDLFRGKTRIVVEPDDQRLRDRRRQPNKGLVQELL
jgi:hypothetical protein